MTIFTVMTLPHGLEGVAEPGGIYISRQAHDHLLEKLSFTCEELGLRNLKNIAEPVEIYSVNFNSISMAQEIKYCRAPDGVRLAYATIGQGPPLVKTANWMNHLEYNWESRSGTICWRDWREITRWFDTTHEATGCRIGMSMSFLSRHGSAIWKPWSIPLG